MAKPTADEYADAFKVPYEKLVRSLAESSNVKINIEHAEMRNVDSWAIRIDIEKGDKDNA